jgi:hypothetical protein
VGLRLKSLVCRGQLRASRVFLALRCMTLKKVLRVGAMRCWLHLATKALGVGPAKRCLVLSL